jgi:hypothetical protein
MGFFIYICWIVAKFFVYYLINIHNMDNTGFQIRALKLMTTSSSKLSKLQNTADYKRVFAYSGATQNIISITHTGSTNNGLETVVETFTYENPAVEGSRILSIQTS